MSDYTDERIKILRTASQSLIALYLIGAVLVLSVLDENPYKKAREEVDVLKNLKTELLLSENYSFIATDHIKDVKAFDLIEQKAKDEITKRVILIFSAFANLSESYGTDSEMTYLFSDGENTDMEAHIHHSDIILPNIVQNKLPTLDKIQDWYNFFESGIEIGVQFPTEEFIINNSMYFFNHANWLIEMNLNESLELYEFDTHFLNPSVLKLDVMKTVLILVHVHLRRI